MNLSVAPDPSAETAALVERATSAPPHHRAVLAAMAQMNPPDPGVEARVRQALEADRVDVEAMLAPVDEHVRQVRGTEPYARSMRAAALASAARGIAAAPDVAHLSYNVEVAFPVLEA